MDEAFDVLVGNVPSLDLWATRKRGEWFYINEERHRVSLLRLGKKDREKVVGTAAAM